MVLIPRRGTAWALETDIRDSTWQEKVLPGPRLQLWFQQNSNTSVGTSSTSSSASGSRVHLTHRYTVPDNLTDTLGPSYSHLHSETENYRVRDTPDDSNTELHTHKQSR